MKNKAVLLCIVAALALSGCASMPEKLAQFERLGLSKVVINGKFSATEYTVEHRDGQRIAHLSHSNLWLPKVEIERRTPVQP